MSGFVHKMFVSKISQEKVLLKAKVTPSQKLREAPREAWVLCSKSGDILCGYCTCTAGFAECCNHVVAILYKIEFANSKGMINPACTDVACSWNVSTQRDVQFKRIIDVEIRKHEFAKQNKKRFVQSKFTASIPAPLSIEEKKRKGCWNFAQCLGMSNLRQRY